MSFTIEYDGIERRAFLRLSGGIAGIFHSYIFIKAYLFEFAVKWLIMSVEISRVSATPGLLIPSFRNMSTFNFLKIRNISSFFLRLFNLFAFADVKLYAMFIPQG